MFDLTESYQLTACETNLAVPAKFVRLTRELAKQKITATWWVGLGVSAALRKQEPDHHWDWTKIVGERRQQDAAECWGLQTLDGDIQAAIAYRIDAVSVLDKDETGQPVPAVFCEYLATSPRNRPRLTAAPAYRGSSAGLLRRAMAHSYALGFDGRISLASLPHPDTLRFYANHGFVPTGVTIHDMMVFEISPDHARAHLIKAGMVMMGVAVKGPTDDGPLVAGGVPIPAFMVRKHPISLPADADDLTTHLLRLLALHPGLSLDFRAADISAMAKTDKLTLLRDINDVLGIKPLKPA